MFQVPIVFLRLSGIYNTMPGGSSVQWDGLCQGGLVYGSSQDVPGMVRYPRCPRILCQGGLVYGSSQDVPGMVRYPRCPRILCQGGLVYGHPGCSWDGQVSQVS